MWSKTQWSGSQPAHLAVWQKSCMTLRNSIPAIPMKSNSFAPGPIAKVISTSKTDLSQDTMDRKDHHQSALSLQQPSVQNPRKDSGGSSDPLFHFSSPNALQTDFLKTLIHTSDGGSLSCFHPPASRHHSLNTYFKTIPILVDFWYLAFPNGWVNNTNRIHTHQSQRAFQKNE